MLQLITETAPMIPQVPYVDWKGLYHRIGDAINVPDLGALVDIDMAMEMAQMQADAAEGDKPEPARLAKDLGKAAEAGKARPKITEAARGTITDRAQMTNMVGQQTGTEAQRLFQGTP